MASADSALNLELIKKRCSRCDLRELCLPAGLEPGDVDRIDQIVASRETLAAGLVLETVSRLFGRLQDMGVLSVRRREVEILDHDRLRELGEE